MSKRVPKRVLAHMLEMPWAITEESLQTILAIVHRTNADPAAIAAELGRPLDNTREVTLRNGVATIPIIGPLVRYASSFSAISGATSYEELATDFTTAIRDPNVRSILLAIDSPGGQTTGLDEIAAMIYNARNVKPIVAHVQGLGASAAYWIASAASEVVAAPTAMLGSIGAILSIVDNREARAKAGVVVHEIVSSQSPAKNSDPATTEGRARIQQIADALGAMFVSAVAQYRGVSEDTVINDFGRGHVLVGQAAVKAGLADRLGTYESVLAQLAGRSPSARPSGPRAATPPQETTMEIDLASASAEQIAAAHPELVAAWRNEGATAERGRINGIAAIVAPGHDVLRTAAMQDAACTPEMFAHRVLAAEEAQRRNVVAQLANAEQQLDAPKAAPKTGADDAPTGFARGRALAQKYLPANQQNRS